MESRSRVRSPSALPDEQYDLILKHLAGKKLKRKEQKGSVKTALNKCRDWKFSTKETKELAHDGKPQQRLMFTDVTSGRSLVVMRQSEFCHLVDFFRKNHSRAGAKKLSHIMGQIYAGVGRKAIQNALNICSDNHVQAPSHTLTPLVPLEAERPLNRLHVDLIDLVKSPCEVGSDQTYCSVLSLLDVFSQYLWLYPLTSKEDSIVAMHLQAHFYDWGAPKVVECDYGTEFGKEAKTVVEKNGGKLVKKSIEHPSEEEDECSHEIWKNDLWFERLTDEYGSSTRAMWFQHLKEFQRNYNGMVHRCLGVSPYKALFGVEPHRSECHIIHDGERLPDRCRREVRNLSSEHQNCHGNDGNIPKDGSDDSDGDLPDVSDVIRCTNPCIPQESAEKTLAENKPAVRTTKKRKLLRMQSFNNKGAAHNQPAKPVKVKLPSAQKMLSKHIKVHKEVLPARPSMSCSDFAALVKQVIEEDAAEMYRMKGTTSSRPAYVRLGLHRLGERRKLNNDVSYGCPPLSPEDLEEVHKIILQEICVFVEENSDSIFAFRRQTFQIPGINEELQVDFRRRVLEPFIIMTVVQKLYSLSDEEALRQVGDYGLLRLLQQREQQKGNVTRRGKPDF